MTYLLDVNLLMALLWENHEHHARARLWLRGVLAFATCPLAQLGFIRVSSHPLLGYGLVPEDAAHVLRRFLSDSRHRFVPNDISCSDCPQLTERMASANQVTDHYFAAIARQHGLCVATFDRQLYSNFADEPELISLVP